MTLEVTLLNGNNVQVKSTEAKSFAQRLEEKYPTPAADKLLEEQPEVENFDWHKFNK